VLGISLVFVFISLVSPPLDTQAEHITNHSPHPQKISSSTAVSPLGENFLFYDAGGDISISAKPAIQSSGENFLAAWMHNGTWEVMASRVSTAGVRLDDPPLVLSQAASIGVNPSVGFDGTNYLVVWVSCGAGTYDWTCLGELYASRVAQDGTILDPGGVKLTTGSGALVRKLGIAFDGTNFLVVWRVGTHGTEVRGTRLSASGTPTNLDDASGFKISEGDWSRYPAVAYGDGVYLVAWHKDECQYGNQYIQAARVYTDGTVVDPANFTINDGDGCQEQAVIGWDGKYFQVAWYNWYWETGKRYASGSVTRVTTHGVVLDTPAITLSNYLRSVSLACNDIDCLYTWDVEHDSEFNWRLTDSYAWRIDQEGNFIEPQPVPVSTSSGHQWGPNVARNGDRSLVLWDDRRDSGNRAMIYGQILETIPQSGVEPQNTAQIEVISDTLSEETVSGNANHEVTTGLAFAENEAYAFGSGVAFHYSGGNWSQIYPSNPMSFYSSWAFGPSSLWVGGWCRSIFRYNGSSWSMECWDWGEPEGDWGFNIYGIWGDQPDQIWAAADRGHILKYNPYHPWINDAWLDMETPTNYDLYDLWGSKWYNQLAVGDRGTVIQYDGDEWRLVENVPTIQSLNEIWGYDAHHIFVVGDWGTILFFNGENWTTMTSGTSEHLVDIWGRHPRDVYAVGLHGTLLHFDGAGWSTIDTGHDVDFLSIWGTTNEISGTRTIWIGTRSNLILKKTDEPATFTANPTSEFAPLTAAFTNTSASGYTSVLWDFGDGVTSTVDAPTHTYTANGNYTVTLEVTWPDGSDRAYKPDFIDVYEHEPVDVSFTVSPTIGVEPLIVEFTSSITGDYDQVLWDFGDGLTGTGQVMTHTYGYGYYTVTLTAQGPGGMDKAFRLNQITVKSPAGAFYDANPLGGTEPLTVTFSGGCSGEYETGSFDFGDGQILDTTSFNFEHVYYAGNYTTTSSCVGPWNTGTWIKTIHVEALNKIHIPLIVK
jgi:PKD repeat protein